MFKKQPQNISNVLNSVLRNQGLETPLLQRRLVGAWGDAIREICEDDMAGIIIENTESKEIRNQTLWVKITMPAIRSDLQMSATKLVTILNNKVGAQIISSIRFF
ncbi:MAG: DUF721 domain-containing protein [Prevotella sp.]|nr:DUF721 domain-containing protein [Prevotella sp.]